MKRKVSKFWNEFWSLEYPRQKERKVSNKEIEEIEREGQELCLSPNVGTVPFLVRITKEDGITQSECHNNVLTESTPKVYTRWDT